MKRIILILSVFLSYLTSAYAAGYYYPPVYYPVYTPNYNAPARWYCKSEQRTVDESFSSKPHGYSAHGFTFEVDAEDVNVPFVPDAQYENLILGYEYIKRGYIGDHIAAGVRGVLAFDDYTDENGIEIKSGSSVILEPMIGFHYTSETPYHVTKAPGSYNGKGGHHCDYEYDGSNIISHLLFVQPFYKTGSRDQNGWHAGYEIMYEKFRDKGVTTENDRQYGKYSERFALVLKTGELDDYGTGYGIEMIGAFSNLNNLPRVARSALYMSFGIFDYEKGSRLLFSIGGMM